MSKLAPFAVALALASLAAGCKKREEAPAPAPTEPAAAEPAAATPPPAPAGDPQAAAPTDPAAADLVGKGQMKSCPTAVEGAKVEVADAEGGVVLTITGAAPAATQEIRERAKHLGSLTESGSAEIQHTGKGDGGGKLGRCPVIAKDTTVAVEEVEGGAKVTLKAKRTTDVDWLRAEVRKRQDGAAAATAPIRGE